MSNVASSKFVVLLIFPLLVHLESAHFSTGREDTKKRTTTTRQKVDWKRRPTDDKRHHHHQTTHTNHTEFQFQYFFVLNWIFIFLLNFKCIRPWIANFPNLFSLNLNVGPTV